MLPSMHNTRHRYQCDRYPNRDWATRVVLNETRSPVSLSEKKTDLGTECAVGAQTYVYGSGKTGALRRSAVGLDTVCQYSHEQANIKPGGALWLTFPQGLHAIMHSPSLLPLTIATISLAHDKAILGSLRGLDSRVLAKVFMYDQLCMPHPWYLDTFNVSNLLPTAYSGALAARSRLTVLITTP